MTGGCDVSVVPHRPASPRLASAIRALREQQDMTQEDLAFEAGLVPGSISRIETCQRNPSWTTVESIAAALEVSLAELGAAVERAE